MTMQENVTTPTNKGRSAFKNDIKALQNEYEIHLDGDDIYVNLPMGQLVLSFYETCDYPKNSVGGSVCITTSEGLQQNPSIDFTNKTIKQILVQLVSSNTLEQSSQSSESEDDDDDEEEFDDELQYFTEIAPKKVSVDLIKSQLHMLYTEHAHVGEVYERENTSTFIAYLSISHLHFPKLSTMHKICYDILDANFITIVIEYTSLLAFQTIKVLSSRYESVHSNECWRACYPENVVISDGNSETFALSRALEIFLGRVVNGVDGRESLLRIYQGVLDYFDSPSAWCSACANPHSSDLKCIRPYPCQSPLCIHQSIHVNRKISIGKQIKQHFFISDFLITTTYLAARNNQLIPFPDCGYHVDGKFISVEGNDGVVKLLDKVPPMIELVYLDEEEIEERLKGVDLLLPHLITWIFTSNPNFLYYLHENKIPAIPNAHQLQLVMSNPTREREFQTLKLSATSPKQLFGFHGSALHNWHSILRTSLNTSRVINGRAYGDGVYHALDVQTSQAYAGQKPSVGQWASSMFNFVTCIAVNEIVNSPAKLVSTKPYLVALQEYVQTRFLLIKGDPKPELILPNHEKKGEIQKDEVKWAKLDTSFPLRYDGNVILGIPDNEY